MAPDSAPEVMARIVGGQEARRPRTRAAPR